jgi:choline-sulfatase
MGTGTKNRLEGSKRPNIVVILSDDQGEWAMGCSGNPELHTPNLDRLAAEGVRCTNFFCTSPVCSPARASLLTGRIPSQHGVHDWLSGGRHTGENAIAYLEGQQTYTQRLADHGYECGLSGKWHLGNSEQPQHGFSHWYVHASGGSPYYGAPMIRDGVLQEEERYLTEAITEDALNFLDRQTEAVPFYLSVHYTAPHSPWVGQHPERFVRMYESCAFDSCPQEAAHPWSIPNPPWGEDSRANLIGYYAAITAMDEQIGRILSKLEQLGLRKDTLVVFLSDNGFNCGHHGFWGKGNGTFPLNLYDTSIKVPAIFSQPGVLPEGRVLGKLLSGYDFMPTLLEYAGVRCPEAEAASLPGSSFCDALLGKEADGEEGHVVVYDEYGPVRMIRNQRWKYIHRYPYGPHELYDLTADPGEKQNLTEEPRYKSVRLELAKQLEAWFLRYVDPAYDGVRASVTGAGQRDLYGPHAF